MAKKVKIKAAQEEESKLPKLSEMLQLVEDGIAKPSSVIGLSVYYVHPKHHNIGWGWVLNFGNDKVFILDHEDKNIVMVEAVDMTHTATEAEEIKRDKYWW